MTARLAPCRQVPLNYKGGRTSVATPGSGQIPAERARGTRRGATIAENPRLRMTLSTHARHEGLVVHLELASDVGDRTMLVEHQGGCVSLRDWDG